jgi:hypothetical protein
VALSSFLFLFLLFFYYFILAFSYDGARRLNALCPGYETERALSNGIEHTLPGFLFVAPSSSLLPFFLVGGGCRRRALVSMLGCGARRSHTRHNLNARHAQRLTRFFLFVSIFSHNHVSVKAPYAPSRKENTLVRTVQSMPRQGRSSWRCIFFLGCVKCVAAGAPPG